LGADSGPVRIDQREIAKETGRKGRFGGQEAEVPPLGIAE
jgi:hypothetical protein